VTWYVDTSACDKLVRESTEARRALAAAAAGLGYGVAAPSP
jgi:hypothetical protein